MAREVVSGVGKNSKRTDLNPSRQQKRYIAGGTYGEGKALMEQQQGAKLAGKPGKVLKSQIPAVPAGLTPLTAPTERPFEAPEVGMPFGAGPGPEQVGLQLGAGQPESPRKQDLKKLTNYIPLIEFAANQEGAPATLSSFVKYLRSL